MACRNWLSYPGSSKKDRSDSRRKNFYVPENIEMGFAATCSPNQKASINTLQDFNVSTTRSRANVQFLATFVKACPEWLPLHLSSLSQTIWISNLLRINVKCYKSSQRKFSAEGCGLRVDRGVGPPLSVHQLGSWQPPISPMIRKLARPYKSTD
jgi:hypothetical protein